MTPQSEFKFRKVVSFQKTEHVPHGLVNVYDRETDRHIGQMNPVKSGGYLLRDVAGVVLSDHDSGRTPGYVALSREPAARMLRLYVDKQAERLALRVGSVSEGCPNTWHNTSEYRGQTACPECPTQLGIRFAIKILEGAGLQGPVFAAILSGELYDELKVQGQAQVGR